MLLYYVIAYCTDNVMINNYHSIILEAYATFFDWNSLKMYVRERVINDSVQYLILFWIMLFV